MFYLKLIQSFQEPCYDCLKYLINTNDFLMLFREMQFFSKIYYLEKFSLVEIMFTKYTWLLCNKIYYT